MKAKLFSDGSCRTNPGIAACAYVIRDDAGRVLAEIGFAIGTATNNVAEYKALIAGLTRAHDLGVTDIEAYSDSQLVVNHVNRKWTAYDPTLAELAHTAWVTSRYFDSFMLSWIPRTENRRADWIANRAMRDALKEDEHGRNDDSDLRVLADDVDTDAPNLFSDSEADPSVGADEAAAETGDSGLREPDRGEDAVRGAKYGPHNDPFQKLHSGEPHFFLRAQDVLAPVAIDSYAGFIDSVAFGRRDRAAWMAMASEVREIARAFRRWQDANQDKVKLPD